MSHSTADLLVPLSHLSPSDTNPRKRMTPAALAELAESIAAHGVMQPVLARPRPGATPGMPPLEIIAGHRRWSACSKLAEAGRNPHGAAIPTLVHQDLTDAQVLALQLVENIQREDLHPLEEAEHYQRMRSDPAAPASVEDIAQVAKISPSRVYERLSLLQLVPVAREAFLADKLSLKTALQVARLPAQVQPEATAHLADWGGEPMAPKAAAAFLRDRYMLRLAHAPFSITDEKLVPEAGHCGTCPKRTGVNPQLFGDITDADICTDTACFAAKKAAQRARLVDELRVTGFQVLQGDAAREACTPDGRGLKPGRYLLEAQVPHELGDPKLKIVDVLTRAQAPNAHTQAIDHDANPVVVYAVGTAELEAALRKLKVHRSQLDKAAAKAKAPAPAPAPSAAPAAPAPAPAAADEAQGGEHDDGRPKTRTATFEEWPFPGTEPGTDPGAQRKPEMDEALLAQLLDFKPPATVAGRYNGHSPAAYQANQERRAAAIITAARVGFTMRMDGAEGLPSRGVPHMIIVGNLYADLYLQPEEVAQLCGVAPPATSTHRDRISWALGLPDEEACRVAMVMLAATESSGEDGFESFAGRCAEALDIDTRDVPDLSAQLVRQRLQLAAVETGKPAAKKPRAKAQGSAA